MPIPAGSETSTAMASQADVEADPAIGRALTPAETAKVGGSLDSASDYVRTETGRKWAAGTFTVRRRVRGGRLDLDSPSGVVSVQAIDTLGTATDVTGYTLRGSTLYSLGYAEWVEVTYTSDGIVPDDLRRVVAAMAARDITNERPEGATSYTVSRGPFSESASYDEPNDAALPTPSEARIIRKYATGKTRSVSVL